MYLNCGGGVGRRAVVVVKWNDRIMAGRDCRISLVQYCMNAGFSVSRIIE